MKQQTFSDIEYSGRKRRTKRKKFLEIMNDIIPWEEWLALIKPLYYKSKRGQPSKGVGKMLRMYLLQIWFSLSDESVEDAIYDNYPLLIKIQRLLSKTYLDASSNLWMCARAGYKLKFSM